MGDNRGFHAGATEVAFCRLHVRFYKPVASGLWLRLLEQKCKLTHAFTVCVKIPGFNTAWLLLVNIEER